MKKLLDDFSMLLKNVKGIEPQIGDKILFNNKREGVSFILKMNKSNDIPDIVKLQQIYDSCVDIDMPISLVEMTTYVKEVSNSKIMIVNKVISNLKAIKEHFSDFLSVFSNDVILKADKETLKRIKALGSFIEAIEDMLNNILEQQKNNIIFDYLLKILK